MRFVVLALLISLLAAAPGSAISPYLVRDISQVHQPIDSNPTSFVSLGALALFTADSHYDLWASNGTAAGTHVIRPDFEGYPIVQAGDTAYYVSRQGGNPAALWSSRGTADTTQNLGAFLQVAYPWTRVVTVPGQRRIFFNADEGTHGSELWTSDGTPAGTQLVIDLRPGDRGSQMAQLTWFKGRLYFSADDGRGFALWSTDGTAAGTRRIRTFPDPPSFGPTFLRALPNRLVFFASGRGRGLDLWSSDGTTAGTLPLPEIAPGARNSGASDAIVLGNRYYTIASDSRTGLDLWSTDGTARGTRRLTNFVPPDPFDPAFANFFSPYQLPNRLVFYADDGSNGAEPWVSDGTVAGTKLLADLCPGACSSYAATLPSPPSRLLIGAVTPAAGGEFWSTDGTAAGTRLVNDICPGTCSPHYYGFNLLGGRILFAANDATHGQQLWTTDGTPAGTARVSALAAPMPFGNYFPGAVAGGNLLFPGLDAVHGRELWATRGRLGTTRLVADLEPGEAEASGSLPTDFTSAGSRAFFFADDGIHGWELWSSDGTAEGTRISSDFLPGGEPRTPPNDVRASGGDGHMIFAASVDPLVDHDFWVADGTPEGTVPILGFEGQQIKEVKVVGGRPYFVAMDLLTTSSTLWQTDWTGVPRTAVAASPGIGWLHDFGGRLLFTRSGTVEGRELWSDDGTSGAQRLAEVIPESEPSPFAGELWFYGRTPEGERGVWATDGTAAGTAKRLDVHEEYGFSTAPIAGGTATLYLFGTGESGSGLYASEGTAATLRFLGPIGPHFATDTIKAPTVLGDRLFFEAANPEAPAESLLWSSDGTVPGTAPLRDSAGGALLNPSYLQLFGGKVVGFLSRAWFVSDGTPAGTATFEPELALGRTGPAQAADRLFFGATTPETGAELWALQP